LWLFNSDAHLERFEFNWDADLREHVDGITGAMSDTENDDAGRQKAGGGFEASDLARFDDESIEFTIKADLSSHLDDLLTECLDDGRQPVAAEMRLGLVDDGGLPLGSGKDFEDAIGIRAGVSASQFAIAEGSRSTFTEEVVALFVEGGATVEGSDVAGSFADASASFDDDGTVTHLGELMGGE
jgi:hypothetical protein